MLEPIYAYIAGMVGIVIYVIYSRKHKLPDKRIITMVLFLLYMTAVVSLTLFPLIYDRTFSSGSDILENRLKLIPFEVISRMLCHSLPVQAVVQIGGNLLMTIPFGVFVPYLFGSKMPKPKKLFYIILAFAFPFMIEFSQFLIGFVFGTFYRTADIDDVILNSTGVFIGYGLYMIIRKVRKK